MKRQKLSLDPVTELLCQKAPLESLLHSLNSLSGFYAVLRLSQLSVTWHETISATEWCLFAQRCHAQRVRRVRELWEQHRPEALFTADSERPSYAFVRASSPVLYAFLNANGLSHCRKCGFSTECADQTALPASVFKRSFGAPLGHCVRCTAPMEERIWQAACAPCEAAHDYVPLQLPFSQSTVIKIDHMCSFCGLVGLRAAIWCSRCANFFQNCSCLMPARCGFTEPLCSCDRCYKCRRCVPMSACALCTPETQCRCQRCVQCNRRICECNSLLSSSSSSSLIGSIVEAEEEEEEYNEDYTHPQGRSSSGGLRL